MSRFATPYLTITGDRQTGKTETLLRQAIRDAEDGRRVLYVAENARVLHNSFLRAAKMIPRLEETRVQGSNGNELILFPRGMIVFNTPRRSVRGMTFDTLLLDDVKESFLDECKPCLDGSKSPRIVRAVFKSAGA